MSWRQKLAEKQHKNALNPLYYGYFVWKTPQLCYTNHMGSLGGQICSGSLLTPLGWKISPPTMHKTIYKF